MRETGLTVCEVIICSPDPPSAAQNWFMQTELYYNERERERGRGNVLITNIQIQGNEFSPPSRACSFLLLPPASLAVGSNSLCVFSRVDEHSWHYCGHSAGQTSRARSVVTSVRSTSPGGSETSRTSVAGNSSRTRKINVSEFCFYPSSFVDAWLSSFFSVVSFLLLRVFSGSKLSS